MKPTTILAVLAALSSANALAWNPAYECVGNDAKKTKLSVALLDSEIIRTREAGGPDRYYRVTDSTEELIESIILGHKSGANARIVPIAKGTMNLTLTKLDVEITVSIKVGKATSTFACK